MSKSENKKMYEKYFLMFDVRAKKNLKTTERAREVAAQQFALIHF